MHVGSEGCPVWSDPTDELLLLKLLKKLVLVLTERCQNTQCVIVCCIWGCIGADQSGCPCWPLTTTEKANSWHRASELHHGVMEEGGLAYITFSFTSCGWLAYLGSTWHHDALWEEGQLAEAVWCFGQCSAGKPWVLPSTWMLLWHLPEHCTPFHGNGLMAVASFSRIMHCATKQKWFRNGLRSTTTSLRCWLGLQIPQISIQSSICGMCLTNKSNPWRPHLATYKT